MRNPGLLAFVATTCVVVPAAIHHLDAGHDQVVKFAAPNTETIELGGATIAARLDHPLVDPGEAIHLQLSATGATGKRLEVGVLVFGSNGNEGDRVPGPPVSVAHETVTLAIDKEGVGSKEVALKLRGALGNRYDSMAFANYTVLVLAPKAADKLDRLRRGAALIGGDVGIPSYNKSGEHFMQLYAWGHEHEGEDIKLFADGTMARLDAYTRSINPAITIENPPTTQAGTAFTVTVAVKNPGKKAATGLALSLDTPTGVVEDSEHAKGISALVMPEFDNFDLAAGETKRFSFRVMPDESGILGLYAHVSCAGSECDADDALTRSGTFDATEILSVKPEPASDPIVGSK